MEDEFRGDKSVKKLSRQLWQAGVRLTLDREDNLEVLSLNAAPSAVPEPQPEVREAVWAYYDSGGDPTFLPQVIAWAMRAGA